MSYLWYRKFIAYFLDIFSTCIAYYEKLRWKLENDNIHHWKVYILFNIYKNVAWKKFKDA